MCGQMRSRVERRAPAALGRAQQPESALLCWRLFHAPQPLCGCAGAGAGCRAAAHGPPVKGELYESRAPSLARFRFAAWYPGQVAAAEAWSGPVRTGCDGRAGTAASCDRLRSLSIECAHANRCAWTPYVHSHAQSHLSCRSVGKIQGQRRSEGRRTSCDEWARLAAS